MLHVIEFVFFYLDLLTESGSLVSGFKILVGYIYLDESVLNVFSGMLK